MKIKVHSGLQRHTSLVEEGLARRPGGESQPTLLCTLTNRASSCGNAAGRLFFVAQIPQISRIFYAIVLAVWERLCNFVNQGTVPCHTQATILWFAFFS